MWGEIILKFKGQRASKVWQWKALSWPFLQLENSYLSLKATQVSPRLESFCDPLLRRSTLSCGPTTPLQVMPVTVIIHIRGTHHSLIYSEIILGHGYVLFTISWSSGKTCDTCGPITSKHVNLKPSSAPATLKHPCWGGRLCWAQHRTSVEGAAVVPIHPGSFQTNR